MDLIGKNWPPDLKKAYWRAQGGCFLIGSLLPSALVVWRRHPHGYDLFLPLAIGAVIFCSPFTVVLCGGVFRAAATLSQRASLGKTMLASITMGAVLAFLNLGGWFGCAMVTQELDVRLSFVQCIMVFLAVGAACGACIGRQAWLAFHPQERLQFSLRTLLLIVLSIGIVLAVLAPGS